MGYLDRAWEAIVDGDFSLALFEMRYSEEARVYPLKIIVARLAPMGRPFGREWLQTPSIMLKGRRPIDVLKRHDHDSWWEVARIFRIRTGEWDWVENLYPRQPAQPEDTPT